MCIKYLYIYKNTKGPQSTETRETDSNSDTDRRTFFLLFSDLGYMCGRQNHKDMTS